MACVCVSVTRTCNPWQVEFSQPSEAEGRTIAASSKNKTGGGGGGWTVVAVLLGVSIGYVCVCAGVGKYVSR